MPYDPNAGAGEFGQDEGSHEAVPQPGQPAAGDQGVELPTQEELQQAYDNRQSWERSLKQKDQRYAHVRKVLETAFGRGMDEWNAIDMSDLQAFSLLNSRIRSDPDFAKKWHSALTSTFQESGATKAEASAKATEIVQAAGAQPVQPQTPQIPPEYAQRMARLEAIAVQQEMKSLENTMWGELDSQIQTVAPDLVEDYGPLLEEQVLHGLFFHSDTELMQRAYDGTLPELVGAYVKQAADRLRGTTNAALQRKATGTGPGKKPVAPPPFGAVTAGKAAPTPEAMTLKQMHARFLRAVEQPE